MLTLAVYSSLGEIHNLKSYFLEVLIFKECDDSSDGLSYLVN